MYFGHQQTLTWCREILDVVINTSTAERRAESIEVAFFPGFVSLSEASRMVEGSGIRVGAQDVAPSSAGAQTGEVSAETLAEVGCTYVELGHVERRQLFGETKELVAQKTESVVRNGLIPLICVGEGVEGDAVDAAKICLTQLEVTLANLGPAGLVTPVVVAYEPVWAIGKQRHAGAAHVSSVIEKLRSAAKSHTAISEFKVIYGGSAGPESFEELSEYVDGFFIGRFGHDPDKFQQALNSGMMVNS